MKEERKRLIFSLVCVTVFCIVAITGCKKREHIPLPEVNTTEMIVVTPVSALASGTVISVGAELKEKGICWSESPSPTIKDNKATSYIYPYLITFEVLIDSLIPETKYYARAYATSIAGTGYGEELSFVTPLDISGEKGTVTDADGNVYPTIGIGAQIWMAENLKTTRFNDGAPIPEVSGRTAWNNRWTPAYCWYENDEESGRDIYGALYNWFAVGTGKLCPIGWHVPDNTEWKALVTYLGGIKVAGGKMKVPGTQFWEQPNTGATNSSGFSGLPAGCRADYGEFYSKGVNLVLWTSSINNSTSAWCYVISAFSDDLENHPKDSSTGYSIRCIKD